MNSSTDDAGIAPLAIGVRNYNLFGSLMAPGGGRLLWLETYNQTFSYPASSITRENFLAAGWSAALDDRLTALAFNAGTLLGAQGGILLLPFILVGLWSLRRDLRTRIAVTGWLLLLFAMTVIFPFAGPRGSFFHAGAAFQPYWWALAPIGLNLAVQSARRRGMFADNAYVVFQGMLVLLAALMTWFMVDLRLRAVWGEEAGIYARVEQRFLAMGISPEVGVIVRNPPGYYISSGRPAIALPYGSEWTIVQVAQRYGASLVVLERGGTFEAVQGLYDDPQGSAAFVYLGEVDEAKLYRVVLDP